MEVEEHPIPLRVRRDVINTHSLNKFDFEIKDAMAAFGSCGNISSVCIFPSGRECHVTFETEKAKLCALSLKKTCRNHKLVVIDFARNRHQVVHVNNLSKDVTAEDLIQFLNAGSVVNLHIKENARGRVNAKIQFAPDANVGMALKQHGKLLKGRAVVVKLSKEGANAKAGSVKIISKPQVCKSVKALVIDSTGENESDEEEVDADGCSDHEDEVAADEEESESCDDDDDEEEEEESEGCDEEESADDDDEDEESVEDVDESEDSQVESDE